MENNITFNIEKFVKKDIESIWSNYRDFIKYSPVTVKNLLYNSIIFIGLNPSIPKNYSEKDPLKLDSYELLQQGKNHRYFRKFSYIAEKLLQNWSYIDLLYLRDTNQKNIANILKEKNEPKYKFISSQLEVTNKLIKSIICKASPILFVVNNALARKLFFHETPYSLNNPIGDTFHFIWDDKFGTYMFNDIPFYFTGMLTGQRALDNGSLERLIWQIKLFTNREKM